MGTIVHMPKLSDTMKTGTIARWLKKEKEHIGRGAPLVEIETDKAVMEHESTHKGILLKIIVEDGQSCALGAPIAVIGNEHENWQDILKGKNTSINTQEKHEEQNNRQTDTPIKLHPQELQPSIRIKASPLAKKLAKQHNVSLSQIQGTGPQGRIIKNDINQHISITPSSPWCKSDSWSRIDITNMRKIIGTRLVESIHNAPHFYLSTTLNMEPVLLWREKQQTKDFSINDLLMFLLARTLMFFPNINACFHNDHIRQYHVVHLNMAVSLKDGLVTPLISNANTKTLSELAVESRHLTQMSRENRLSHTQMSSGTFTVSNLGMFGIEDFTSILNPPQVGILSVGSVQTIPKWEDKEWTGQRSMKVTLGCDHRAVDGAQAAAFLKHLQHTFQDPLHTLFYGKS